MAPPAPPTSGCLLSCYISSPTDVFFTIQNFKSCSKRNRGFLYAVMEWKLNKNEGYKQFGKQYFKTSQQILEQVCINCRKIGSLKFAEENIHKPLVRLL